MRIKGYLASAVMGGGFSFILKLVGGIDTSMGTLFLFMVIDFITGLILASFFKESLKSKDGRLSSVSGAKGIAKKGSILLVVIIANRLDIQLSTEYIRNGVIMSYIIIEGVSILENLKLMGVPIPQQISDALEVKRRDNK